MVNGTGDTTCNTVNCGATGSFGNITTSGNLTVTGVYGAWARYNLYGTSYTASATTAIGWTTSFTSSNITHTANTATFAVSQAGVYKFDCQIYFQTYYAAALLLNLQRSTNSGSTWVTQSINPSMTGSSQSILCMAISTLVQATAGDWFQYTITNPLTYAVLISSSSANTFHSVCRVG